MAKVVLGIGCSHGPMLSTAPDQWHLRAGADRANPQHWYRGQAYAFDALKATRARSFEVESAAEERIRRYERSQRALDALARQFAAAQVDLAVIVGNDQLEVFKEDLIPAIVLYTGRTIENVPLNEIQIARLPPGIAVAERGHCLEEGAVYPGAPESAAALLRSLVAQDFDISCADRFNALPDRMNGIPHAFGFLYRRIMRDAPPPSVPVFLNVGVEPNQLPVARCLKFGRALGRAIRELPGDLRVAVLASGGLTHFVIDEELDQRLLEAMRMRDEAALAAIPENWFKGNTCECKSWLAVSAAMNELGLACRLVDYVPCYRSEAGTGNAMGFVVWQ